MTFPASTKFLEFCIQCSSLALVYYDYFLTLDREIKFIWQRKFHFLTLMYIFCRYSLVSNVVFMWGLVNNAQGHGDRCNIAYTICSSLTVLSRVGILVILGVRTCALWKNSRLVVAPLALLGTFVICLAVAHATTVSCTGSKVNKNRIATDLLCVFTVTFELTATGLLASACLRHLKSDSGLEMLIQKQSLFTFMLKDGLLYAGFVTAFTTTALVLNYAAPDGSFFQRLLNAFTIPISGIMSARFLLHIREWQALDLKGGHAAIASTQDLRFQLPIAHTTQAGAHRDSNGTLETDCPSLVHFKPQNDNEGLEGPETMEVYRRQDPPSAMV